MKIEEKMPRQELTQSDIIALLQSVNSENTRRDLDIFFGASPDLRKLKKYAEKRGIKFGIDRDGIFLEEKKGKPSLTYLFLLISSREGVIKERIILIPTFVVATFNLRPVKGKWLKKNIFAIAHEIGHGETMTEIPAKQCDETSCLYREVAANNRALDILKKNKINMERDLFVEFTSDGISADKNHVICAQKIKEGLCPYSP